MTTDAADGPALTERATFGRRLAAWFIDGVVISLIGGAIMIPTTALASASTGPGRLWLSFVFSALMGTIYTSWEFTHAGTWGKKLMGLEIRGVDGRPARRDDLFWRWAFKQSPLLFGLLTALPLINGVARSAGGFMALFVPVCQLFALGPRRQTLYDRISETVVFKTP